MQIVIHQFNRDSLLRHSFTHNCLTDELVHPSIHSFIRSFFQSAIIHLFIHSLFMHAFIHSLVTHSLVTHAFICHLSTRNSLRMIVVACLRSLTFATEFGENVPPRTNGAISARNAWNTRTLSSLLIAHSALTRSVRIAVAGLAGSVCNVRIAVVAVGATEIRRIRR